MLAVRSCIASTGWLKAPSSLQDCLPPTMVWDQARAKQRMNELQGMTGEGGEDTQQAGPPAQKASPPPAQGEPELHREKGGIVLVGFTILLISLSVFLAKKSQGGNPQSRDSLASTDQGGDRRACKRGSGTSWPRSTSSLKSFLWRWSRSPRKPRQSERPLRRWIFSCSL